MGTSPWGPAMAGVAVMSMLGRERDPRPTATNPPRPAACEPALLAVGWSSCFLWSALNPQGLPQPPTPSRTAWPAGAKRMSDDLPTQDGESLPSTSPKSFPWSRRLCPTERALIRVRRPGSCCPLIATAAEPWARRHASPAVLSPSPMER